MTPETPDQRRQRAVVEAEVAALGYPPRSAEAANYRRGRGFDDVLGVFTGGIATDGVAA